VIIFSDNITWPSWPPNLGVPPEIPEVGVFQTRTSASAILGPAILDEGDAPEWDAANSTIPESQRLVTEPDCSPVHRLAFGMGQQGTVSLAPLQARHARAGCELMAYRCESNAAPVAFLLDDFQNRIRAIGHDDHTSGSRCLPGSQ
jgi:hypothetical protein